MALPKIEAPGLKWRSRAGGQSAPYWIARADLVRAGYTPKTVRLEFDPADPDREAKLAHRCRVLQAEMLEWSSGRKPHEAFDGTLRSLCQAYLTDPDSPFQEKRQKTKQGYEAVLRRLAQAVGDRRIDAVTGMDVKRWYKTIAAGNSAAYAALNISVLKNAISYGASRGANLCSPNPCISLREQISALRLAKGAPRHTQLTYAQVEAFRKAAHALDRPSMALGVTLQFDCSMRQRDVIGTYENGHWEGGLTWKDIGTDGVLRKKTSKTGAEVAHRIADYPDLAAELERQPHRLGPLVINEGTGSPYREKQYRKTFRKIARAAGIPDEVWNMDARAGAVTEAYEAGAKTEGAMALAGHTQASTSRRYNRSLVEQTSNVARLRVESRKK